MNRHHSYCILCRSPTGETRLEPDAQGNKERLRLVSCSACGVAFNLGFTEPAEHWLPPPGAVARILVQRFVQRWTEDRNRNEILIISDRQLGDGSVSWETARRQGAKSLAPSEALAYEWSSNEGGISVVCPCCAQSKDSSHSSDCELAALLV